MRPLSSVVFLACLLLGSGCAYLGHRARDFGDVFTLAVEDKRVGCTARFLVPIGISASEGSGYGLCEGHMGRYEYIDNVGFVILIPNLLVWDLDFTPEDDCRDKSYWLDVNGMSVDGGAGGTYRIWREGLNVQAGLGLYYGVRVGVNLPEVMDYLLGWTTLDILNDDRAIPAQ